MFQHVECVGFLAALSVSYSILVTRVEALRLAVTSGQTPNLSNVWVIAAALLVGPGWLLPLVAVMYLAEWPVRRGVGSNLGKHIYGGVALAASGEAAWGVTRILPGWVGIPPAIVVYLLTDVALVAGAITMAREYAYLKMFRSVRGHLIEMSTAGLGVALAAGMSLYPALSLCAVPVLLGLHRRALWDAVRSTRAYDPATRLWNERGWRVQAHYMLADSSPGRLMVLLIEPDDDPLDMVALVCTSGGWVRPTDLAGRYHGGQMVVMMRVGPTGGAAICADGIRQNLAGQGIGASLGYAEAGSGSALDELLVTAMSEMVIDGALRVRNRS